MGRGKSKSWKQSSSPASYHTPAPRSRESFVRTTCRMFVLNEVSPLEAESDPDASIPWDSVEYVQVQCDDDQRCPICLGPPIAPKMTRCGHIFCWVCIIQHIDGGEKGWNYCPLCEDFTVARDLRSVVFHFVPKISVGSHMSFQLMKRGRNSTLAVPCAQFSSFLAIPDYRFFEGDKRGFGIQRVNAADVLSEIVDRDENHLCSDEYESDDKYAKQALEACASRRRSLLSSLSIQKGSSPPLSPLKPGSPPEGKPRQTSELHQNPIAFHQGVGGVLAFLDPLNNRMLKQEFGAYENMPEIVEGIIVDVEKLAITEDSRKRHKYLNHLPFGSEVTVCELDLSHIVSKETMELFADQLSQKQAQRQQKVRDERKLDRKARQAEEQREREMRDRLEELNRRPILDTFENPTNFDDEFFRVAIVDNPAAPPSSSFAHIAKRGIMADEEANPPLSAAVTHLPSSRPQGVWAAKSMVPVVTSLSLSSPTRTIGTLPKPASSESPLHPWSTKAEGSPPQSLASPLPAAPPKSTMSPSSVQSPSKKKGNKKGRLLFSTSFPGMQAEDC